MQGLDNAIRTLLGHRDYGAAPDAFGSDAATPWPRSTALEHR